MSILEVPSELQELPCYLLYVGWRRASACYAPAFALAGRRPIARPTSAPTAGGASAASRIGPGGSQRLNPQRMYVLEHLSRHPDTTVGALAALLEVDAGTISGLLSRMARDGLVQRRRDPADKLQVLLRCTPVGRRLHRRIARQIQHIDQQVLAALRPRDLTALRRVVDAFLQAGLPS
jgi:DNA-binding MarR family transcriptional regulator